MPYRGSRHGVLGICMTANIEYHLAIPQDLPQQYSSEQ